ncbi:hypothetical protein IEQ34_004305 [Dendrobium chrysotoxum]|uniref:50S ribosomal protein L22, chloroplastic n=1 Tax=Dendrobium chrysotoxum TaxID=161865 RepID=A0AAV7HDY6_DENCH|nr:hypothetical protein IEQ34_004305 [Dendrobium chrysotoxum]
MPYRASYPILKLVYSAAANASHNMGLNEADLFISKAEVNRGAIVKKLRPRARGRKRKTFLVLQEINKHRIVMRQAVKKKRMGQILQSCAAKKKSNQISYNDPSKKVGKDSSFKKRNQHNSLLPSLKRFYNTKCQGNAISNDPVFKEICRNYYYINAINNFHSPAPFSRKRTQSANKYMCVVSNTALLFEKKYRCIIDGGLTLDNLLLPLLRVSPAASQSGSASTAPRSSSSNFTLLRFLILLPTPTECPSAPIRFLTFPCFSSFLSSISLSLSFSDSASLKISDFTIGAAELPGSSRSGISRGFLSRRLYTKIGLSALPQRSPPRKRPVSCFSSPVHSSSSSATSFRALTFLETTLEDPLELTQGVVEEYT